ncbi:YkyA family protein [Sporosarcina jeotgali]|uniref:YkyA family protein n=1 Tax=Sporosarcina jeotgali TaxID=3020056 RepID=A0ABZ0KZV5_9BACL|nr:YkyA family protein [Sporosarcina sp. B2O-1]WOV84926.1 YkyA family protein [Sporosarcina sp. B2O-1]
MKRIGFFVMIASLFTVLTGCQTDKKEAAEIHKKIEDSAVLEEKFAENQKELAASRKKVNESNQKILGLKSTEAAAIKQTINNQEISTERRELDEAQENFQNAYAALMTIDENIKLIKDKDEKKLATNVMTLMKDRKKLMDSYFDIYQMQLNSQSKFFDNLEQGNFQLDTLEEQVETINDESKKMHDVAEQVNQVTKNYNEVKSKYFEMAGLS